MVIVFAALLVYIILLIVLLIGLNKTVTEEVASDTRIHSISIIIPFRNEIDHLPNLIESLQSQDYPSFEVIFVDDHSADGGDALVGKKCHADKRFHRIRATGQGKKSAITDGIRAANGEIAVTTDADCTFGPRWLSELNRPFSDEKVMLTFGPVHMKRGTTLFQGLQQIEFASVMGSGIAMFGLGHPLYCNGANLAYRKEVFEELGGFEGNQHVASGDDQFLLDKIKSNYDDGVFFLNAGDALVSTMPQTTLKGFVHQRIRWAGKWSSAMNNFGKALAVVIFLVQFVTIASWWLMVSNPSPGLLVMISVKLLLEFILISTTMAAAGQRTSFLHFMILQLIYPFYVIAIGLLANFASFEWKGREHPPLQRI